ncbi:kinase-like domain-containing protein [Cyathus striatus]|nr:kinase-like domain-containing protein [Cyathus striatus]
MSVSRTVYRPRPSVKITSRLDTSVSTHVRINQYYRGPRIGKGNHGEVYLCEDSSEEENAVAVKIVKRSHPRDKLKLMRKNYQTAECISNPEGCFKPILGSAESSVRKEIAILKSCCHLHICRLLEVIDDPKHEKIYLIMEYLSGGPVEWTNSDDEPILTLEQTRRIMRDVLLGLEYLHSRGVIHRDIKPANLMYARDRSHIKIIDFGVAHAAPIVQHNTGINNHDKEVYSGYPDRRMFPESDLLRRVGTPSFMAPEIVWFLDNVQEDQSMHKAHPAKQSLSNIPSSASSITIRQPNPIPSQRPPITKAVDMWSLAVTFYCLLFGRTPFCVPASANKNVHHNEYVLYMQICTQDWAAYETMGAEKVTTGGRHPKDVTSEGFVIVQLLEQMLQKDPRNRMTLKELKHHPWILKNLPHPKQWLWLTSPDKSDRPGRCRWISVMSQKLRSLFSG